MATTPSKWRRFRREFSRWAERRSREPGESKRTTTAAPLLTVERAEFDGLVANYGSNDSLFDWAEREVDGLAVPLFAEGQVLAGRFQIVRFLGRGGMGEVYEATNKTLPGSRIALKTLNAEVRQRPDAARRFIREVELAQRVTHANICRIHDIFPFVVTETNGNEVQGHFLTMQLLDGESLANYIADRGKLSLEEALPILKGLAEALDAAHAENVIHRDLKPGNVILVKRLGVVQPIITDFGLAALADRAPENEGERSLERFTRAGTPSYAAPEQLIDGQSGPASDVYSLGVVALEMLTGETAVSGLEALPATERKAIARCLEAEPGKRFARPPDFVVALTGQKPSEAPRPRSNKGPLILSVIALAAVSLVAYFKGSNAREQIVTLLSTDGSAQQILPSLSADGKKVLYASNRSGNWDIYLQDVASKRVVNLTADNPGDDSEPAFSADGRFVAFFSNRPTGSGIYVMRTDGSHLRQLSPFGRQPAWSPDGKRIVFAEEALLDPLSKTTLRSALWIANLSGGVQKIYDGDAAQPRWSPGGNRIAFVAVANGKRRLGTISPDGSTPRFLSSVGDVQWSPDWAADGRFLYFCSDRNGSMNVWKVRIHEDTGEFASDPESVVVPGQYIGQLSLARTGNALAYMQDTSRTTIYRLQFGASSELKAFPQSIRVTSHGQLAAGVSPSPDGKSVVYATARYHENIYLAKADDATSVQLTNSDSADRVPHWSPDGSHIAFQSLRSGKWEIWMMDPNGGKVRQLSSTRGVSVSPVWSPDGSRIAFSELDVGIHILDILHGKPGSLPSVTSTLPINVGPSLFFLAKAWSPDGHLLAGALHRKDGSSAGIAVQDVSDGHIEALSHDDGESPVWLKDNRHLVYRAGGKLMILDKRGLNTRLLLPYPQYTVSDSLGISLANNCLFFTNLEQQMDIVVVSINHTD